MIGERIDALYGDRTWPDRRLWICAVDLDSGDRVVFGHDGPEVRVGVAVQASSAIPGFFRPVEHGGRRYVDGGVHSPTNADIVTDARFDIVVISSPMSATRLAHGAMLPSARPVHARRLADEVARLRRAGCLILTFQPTPADVSAMGRNPMDASRRRPTTAAALASARTRLADPAISERLELLRSVSGR